MKAINISQQMTPNQVNDVIDIYLRRLSSLGDIIELYSGKTSRLIDLKKEYSNEQVEKAKRLLFQLYVMFKYFTSNYTHLVHNKSTNNHNYARI